MEAAQAPLGSDNGREKGTQSVGAAMEEGRQKFVAMLKGLPRAVQRKLYDVPTVCLALQRFIPALGQQVIIRLVLVGRPVPTSLVRQWVLPEHHARLDDVLAALRDLNILEDTVGLGGSGAHGTTGQVVCLNGQFAQNFKLALFGGQTNLEKVIVELKYQKTPAELRTYAIERWQSVLNYMALPSGDSEKLVSLQTRQTLQESGFIKTDGNTCELTSDGFQFLLMTLEQQLWTYLLHCISFMEKRGAPVHNAIVIILYSCFSGLHAYSCAGFSEADLNFLQHLREIGLVYLRKRKIGWFYYTPLLTRLAGSCDVTSETPEKPGFLVVETNFRVYCYTDSVLDLAIVSTFCELLYRFPNLVVAILNRESVRRAFKVNITAKQIIQYLNSNAHSIMRKRRPVIPSSVTDQLKLWELEHDRFTFQEGMLYSNFLSDDDFLALRNYAQDLGVLLWQSEESRLVVVTTDGHEATRQFWKRQKQQRMSAAAAAGDADF